VRGPILAALLFLIGAALCVSFVLSIPASIGHCCSNPGPDLLDVEVVAGLGLMAIGTALFVLELVRYRRRRSR